MVGSAEGEPTMTEIAVALRETRRSATRLAPFSVIDGQSGGSSALERGREGRTSRGQDAGGDVTGTAELRDDEIRRLVAENTRLNDRIFFLLEVVERESAARTAERAAAADRSTIVNEVRTALEAELRPILAALLGLLERQRTPSPAMLAGPRNEAPRVVQPVARPAVSAAKAPTRNGIIDLDAAPG